MMHIIRGHSFGTSVTTAELKPELEMMRKRLKKIGIPEDMAVMDARPRSL